MRHLLLAYPSLRRHLLVAHLVLWLTCLTLRAEDKFETRYEYYQEDNDRIRVDSDYSLFSVDLSDTVMLNGTFLYSAISGASPSGRPPDFKGGDVPIVSLTDERWGGTLGVTKLIANHTLTAGLAYSYESDYTSRGISLVDTVSLNEKATDLTYGFAYTDDVVGANGSNLSEAKRSYDAILGVSQVVNPTTLFQANLVLGWKRGFLNDPYKGALVDDQFLFENRPNAKFEQLLNLSLTHYFESLGASLELSDRIGHNDQGMWSNTITTAFNKYLFGKRLVLSPRFRFYSQGAADYYATRFTGNPEFYSADYRLSAEQTFSFGVQAHYKFTDSCALDLGYERFISRGTDGITSQSAYPDANILRVGFALKF
jgi:hypothetical protein